VWGRRTVGVIALGGLCSLAAGCFEPPAEAVARLEALKAQGQAMDEALDEVEERLLGSRAMVSLWQEMAWRHRQVTEVACQNVAGHVEAMEKHLTRQTQRARRQQKQRQFDARSEAMTTAPPREKEAREN
jgi:hypothetical protein